MLQNSGEYNQKVTEIKTYWQMFALGDKKHYK